MKTFEDLEVWKRACRLSVQIISSSQRISPRPLQDQIIRSSISIPSNIAEGAERDAPQDFIRFLRIAKGSCAELRTQLYLLQKITSKENQLSFNADLAIQETREISAMLQGLILSIQKSKS